MIWPLRAAVIVASTALAGCMGATAVSVDAPIPRQCNTLVGRPMGERVEWYHPVGTGDNERLDDWCGAVGPPVIVSMPAPSLASAGPGDSVTVAAWNTDAGSGYLMAFVQEELGLQCHGDRSQLAEGAPHFVLLVQEALRRSSLVPDVGPSWAIPPAVSEERHPGARVDVLEVASACGLAAFYAPAARNGLEPRDGLREDKGNAILSTLPLSDFIAIELPYEASRRVVPVATVHNARGDSLRVASVHFITTPPPWRILTTGNTARQRQALALKEALEAIELARRGPECPVATCGAPTLVGGDTNATSVRETALRMLRSEFPDSPVPSIGGTRGWFPTDHLFFRRGAAQSASILVTSYRRIEDTYYSDHHGVIAALVFR